MWQLSSGNMRKGTVLKESGPKLVVELLSGQNVVGHR